MVENLVFNWKVNGENAGADKLKVEVCGHTGEVYKAFDTKLWVCLVDRRGTRDIESEQLAKELAESLIKDKIEKRYDNAIADLALFESAGLVFGK